MRKPNGYLLHGTAFSSKEVAFEALVSSHEQESWFHKIWNENAQPYYFGPQPQLTIPQSIADTLDIAIKGLTEFEDYLWAVDEFDILVPYDRAEYFRKWSNEEMNAHALAVSYVTGKALGVDLVKVVEND
ncbi:hypothetical protein LL14B4_06140 [Lactococcus lactis subsp. lactis]|uniref:Phage protein n=1 Tax=Lactococcus lactis subsp. lactis TaxID=1360 RepID=A0A2Z3KEG7_LACLL|nr:hypothetical protein [Lactococcus lactis]AWN65778.1 hypothetical protein LL14B4_06140 [Lactococcus lactis subsp. lactis]